jgi:hypothetical protein
VALQRWRNWPHLVVGAGWRAAGIDARNRGELDAEGGLDGVRPRGVRTMQGRHSVSPMERRRSLAAPPCYDRCKESWNVDRLGMSTDPPPRNRLHKSVVTYYQS